jgi:acetyl esterase/lipase
VPAVVLALVAGLVAAGCGALSPVVGPAPLRYRDPMFPVDTTSDIKYGSATDQQGTTVALNLDVYRPSGDTVTKRPVVIWLHGGLFESGDKTSSEAVDQATEFARKGYVTASINYRLSPNGCTVRNAECDQAIVDATHDAQAAVRFFRRRARLYGVDPNRIAVGGTSAGGIAALGVGYHSDDPGTSGNPGYSSAVSATVSVSGAVIHTDLVGPGDAPALLFHGTADTVVPYSEANDTLNAAVAADLPAYLIRWEGAGHDAYASNRANFFTHTTNFIYRSLDVEHAGT